MFEARCGPLRVEVHSPESSRYTSRLFLIHGLWAGAWCWRPFGSFLAHRGWEVVAPDLRGRPGSRPARAERITFDDYWTDLCEVVSRECEGLASSDVEGPVLGNVEGPPVVVGHDLGGLLALKLAAEKPCRAAVAIAPPIGGAQTEAYRQLLRSCRGIFRKRLPPPEWRPGEPPLDFSRLQPESPRIARSLLRGEPVLDRPRAPALIVAGSQDPLVDPRRLEAEAKRLGCDFEERASAHWGLDGRGFEHHVDRVHRWLVQQMGADLLRLTGYEDVEEES